MRSGLPGPASPVAPGPWLPGFRDARLPGCPTLGFTDFRGSWPPASLAASVSLVSLACLSVPWSPWPAVPADGVGGSVSAPGRAPRCAPAAPVRTPAACGRPPRCAAPGGDLKDRQQPPPATDLRYPPVDQLMSEARRGARPKGRNPRSTCGCSSVVEHPPSRGKAQCAIPVTRSAPRSRPLRWIR